MTSMDGAVSAPELIQGPRDAWHLLAPIGRGGTARTFKARRVSDDAIQLVKLLEVADAADWKVIELFEREAAVLEAFVHPGTPRYIDHFALADGTRLVLVQELIAGQSLQALIDSGASVSVDRLETWFAQALEILGALHARVPPVVHRDISPKNIIVDGDLLHLVDFGSVKAAVQNSLAKSAERLPATNSTMVTGIGTFGFMPPEQVLGQAEPASDLYALGVTIACVAARAAPDALPFDRRGGRIAIGLIAGLPERLRPLVTDLTHPALDRRCGDAATASERLRSARAGPPGPIGPAAKPRRAKESRRPAAPAPAIAASLSAASEVTEASEASVPKTRDGRIPLARLIGLIVLCVGMATMVVSGFVESIAVTLIGLVLMVGGMVWTIRLGLKDQREFQKAVARRNRVLLNR